MSKCCINCGAPLHDQASFCHICATDQITKQELSPKKQKKYGILLTTLAAIPLAFLSVMVVIALLRVLRPSGGSTSVFAGDSFPSAHPSIFLNSTQISVSKEITTDPGSASSVMPPPSPPPPSKIEVISSKAYADYEDSSGSYRFTLSFNLYPTEPKVNPYTDVFLRPGSSNSEYTSQLYVHNMEDDTILTPDFLDKIEKLQVYITDSYGRHRVSLNAGQDPYALQSAEVDPFSDVVALTWTITMKNGDTIQLSHRLIPMETLQPVISYTDYTLDTIDDLQNMIYALNIVYPPGTVYPPGSTSKVSLKITLPPVIYEAKPLHLENNKYSITGSSALGSGLLTTFTAPIDQTQASTSLFRSVCFRGPGTGLALDFPYRVNCFNCTFDGWDAAIRSQSGGTTLEGCTFKNLTIGVILDEFRYHESSSSSAQIKVSACHFDRVEQIMLLQSPHMPRTVTFKSCSFSESGTPPSSVEQITVIVE